MKVFLLFTGLFLTACQPAPFPPVPHPKKIDLKALTYNVWHGLSTSTFKMKELEPEGRKNQRVELQISRLKALQPDLIFLQEVNPVQKLAQHIGRALGNSYSYVYHRDNCGISLFNVGLPVNLNSGLVVFAKKPLQLRKITALKLSGPLGDCDGAFTFQYAEFRYALFVDIFHPSFGSFYGVLTHLHHGPELSENIKNQLTKWEQEGVLNLKQKLEITQAVEKSAQRRDKELNMLFQHMDKLSGISKKPLILAGDFNFKPSSPAYQRVLAQNLRDVMDSADPLKPFTFNIHANQINHQYTKHLSLPLPVFGKPEVKSWFQTHYLLEPRRIDYIFVSPGVDFSSSALFGDKANAHGLIGSDHFGVVSEISLTP